MSADLKAQDLPMPPGPIEGPAVWYGPAMDASKEWLREFSSDELAELDTTMRSIQAKGLGVIDITRETFPLPNRANSRGHTGRIDQWPRLHADAWHPGGQLYDRRISDGVLWAGCSLGAPQPQNAKGHVLGHVKDLGYHHEDTSVRIYQRRYAKLSIRTDATLSALCSNPRKRAVCRALSLRPRSSTRW